MKKTSANKYWVIYLLTCSGHAEQLDLDHKYYQYKKLSIQKTKKDSSADLNNFDGLYFGLFGGLQFIKAPGHFTGIGDLNIDNQGDIALHGKSLGAFAGYGKTIQGFYIGGEIGGDINYGDGKMDTSKSVNFTTIITRVQLQKKNSFYVVGRMGTQIFRETLLYLKGGVALNTYHIVSKINVTPADLNISSSMAKRIAQPVIGMGIEFYGGKFSQDAKWKIGIEYEKTFARPLHSNMNNADFNSSLKVYPTSDAIKLRFIISL